MLKDSPARRAVGQGFGPVSMVEPLEGRRMLAVNVAVDMGTPLQTIRAIGANVARNARNPDPNAPVRDATSNYLLQNLDIGMLRVAINLKTWEPVNDNADPNVVRAAGFPDRGGIKQNFEMIRDYNARGVKVIASVFDLPDWMVSNPQNVTKRELKPGFETELAEALTHWLLHLKNQYGVTIDLISINEGNGGYNARFNQLIFTNFIKQAGPYMASKGLGYVKWFIGDDGVNTLNAHTKPLLENPDIRQYLGPVAYHSWSYRFINDRDLEQWHVQAQRYGKEVWVTEFGTDAEVANAATFTTWERAHDTALAYWRALAVTRATTVLWWQFGIDYPLVNTQFQPNPVYHIVKPFHDHVKPGAVMVKTTPNNTGAIKSLATRDLANNKFFMQLLNDASPGTSGQTINLSGLPNTPLTVTRSNATAQGQVVGTFTPVGGRLTLSSPANSVLSISGTLNGTGGGTARPPTASISTPATTLQYTAGATINFSGNGTDPDEGTLASGRFKWTITPVRNGLFGTSQTFNGIKSGSFTVPADFQRATDQKYVIQLTVTDATGLTSTKSVEIKPKLVNVTVKSNIAGIHPGLNGLWEPKTAAQPMVAGVQNLFAASPQLVGGKVYKFSSWSIGGAATRTVTATANATYTANFSEVTDGSAGRFFTASADAYVRDGDGADTNYGQDVELIAKNSGDPGKTRYAYLTFDLSSASTTLAAAKLRLFGKLSGNGEVVGTNVFGVSPDWSEDTITFNNRPAFGETPITGKAVADQTGRWYEFDVSTYVKQARAAGASKVSFALAQDGTSSPYAGFNSGETAVGAPQLLISQSVTAPEPPVNTPREITNVADAYVRDARGNSNYGGQTELAVQSGVAGVNRRTYLKFDISSISSTSSVMLKLQGRLSEAFGSGISVGLFDAADNWTESGLTWNNRPREKSTVIGSFRVRDTARRTYEVDLTDYVRAQKAAGRQFVTLVLKNMSNTASAQTVFTARETSGGGARLAIT